MFKSILVPLDGSSLAERALPYATALAKAANGRLVLLRGVDAVHMNQAPEADAANELDAAVARVQAEGVEAERSIYHRYYEEMGPVISEVATDKQVDLIVMSTHGRSGIGRWVYGSVADQVLREAEVPVLLIPPVCERSWPMDGKLRILVPLDRSELSSTALSPATELAQLLGADLILLHAVAPIVYPVGDGYTSMQLDPEEDLNAGKAYLEKTADGLRSNGISVKTMAVVDLPSLGIPAVAREQRADLIIMASHGRGGIARLVMGSVATGTLQRTEVPVLLLRPSGLRQAEDAPTPGTTESVAKSQSSSTSMELSARDLDLIQRGLGELLFSPNCERQLVEPTRKLLARFRQAEVELVQRETVKVGG